MKAALDELVAHVTATAKAVLESGETVIPVAFLLTEAGEVTPCVLQWDTGEEKRALYREVRALQRRMKAALILVNDCYYAVLQPTEPFPVHGVSSHPKRRETLVVVVDGPAGRAVHHYPYRREGDKIVWEEAPAQPESWESRLLGDVLEDVEVRRS